MAYSYVQYAGNGSTVTFSVPFAYIAQAHVEVRVNNVLKAVGTDYTWASANSIQFVTAPANGLTVDIRRKSSPSIRLVDFQDGSTLTEKILDADSNQNFFLAQEATDAVDANIALATDGLFDAKSKRIKNVADPVNPQDAVTKNYADTAMGSQLAQATAQASAAASSASAAQTSANNAGASQTAAASSASTATTKASDASTSATNAANSATSALNSKNAAAISETNAAASAAASASSASSASSSATSATGSANSASNSAATATTKASDASASATQAANSASGAATSATNAASSASSAAGSATSAASSASQASTSATNAAASATSAGTSATTATTKAADAGTSAASAQTSATTANTAATNAASSAASAATSATNAASSATAAAASAASIDVSGFMQKSSNLADVADKTVARNNLGATGFGFKNRIINGAMMIDQRNAGASVTIPASVTYTLDRWYVYSSQASKLSVQQVASALSGFSASLKVTSLSAYTVGSGEVFWLNQPIEGLNAADLGWGASGASAVTLSFKVYSSLTGSFGGAIRNGAGNRSYPFSFTVSAANTWTTVSVTIPGDTSGTWATDNSAFCYVTFSLGAGSTFSGTANSWQTGNLAQPTGSVSIVGTNGATFQITGVQLEKGSTATSFDYRPYGTELALCQRYYETLNTIGNGMTWTTGCCSDPNSLYWNFVYRVPKRAAPTVAFGDTSNWQLYSNSGYRTITSSSMDGSTITNAALVHSTSSSLTSGYAGITRYQGTGIAVYASAEL